MKVRMNTHTQAQELLPWLVNGRIAADDANWLNDHLAACAACRDELVVQQRIRAAIAREPTVEFAPQAAFNRLWKRIEADAHEPSAAALEALPAAAGAAPETRRPRATRDATRPWVRAALSAQAAVILILCGVLWQRPPAPAYRTVTDSPPGRLVAGPVVKAIFADQVRLGDVKEILAASGFVVASGPSEAGVYTLVARDTHAQAISSAALARLRTDPRVRFAEVGAQ